MLTVRFDRLGVGRGDRLLDVGSGGGRHAFEGLRRGAVVAAVDADGEAVRGTAAMMAAMMAAMRAATTSAGEARPAGGCGGGIVGDAFRLPFPAGSFDRVIAAEVLEHLPDDRSAIAELVRVLRPGGTIAVTVPRWLPELVTWAISDEYHLTPGGHVRIYRRSALRSRLEAAGLHLYAGHHAHALHSPYWWLRAAVGVGNDTHPLVRAYHRVLVWDITAGRALTRVPEALLNPVLGKSLVLYARKPGP